MTTALVTLVAWTVTLVGASVLSTDETWRYWLLTALLEAVVFWWSTFTMVAEEEYE